jgi:hypothetical protein
LKGENMRLEDKCLMLEPDDLERIKIDVDNGVHLKEAFELQLHLADINKGDVFDVQAFAKDLAPYEKLIFLILDLLEEE